MTTPLDPYASATSNLPSAVQSIIPGNVIGANSQTINTAEINLSSSGGGAVLGYSGTPSIGNLTFSLSSASGTDSFGNSVATGLMVSSGSVVGVSLVGVQVDATSTLQGTQLNNANVLQPSINGGTAASLVSTMTNGAGSVLGYVSSSSAVTFATNGNYLWTVPSSFTGPTSIRIQCWGAGAGGGGGSPSQGGESGGAGEYAEEPSFTVYPNSVYTIIVGQGGSGGATGNPGSNGGGTVFQYQGGGGSNVTANPGLAGINFVGGVGGSGSTNTIHYDGGDGANASGNTGGAGGGGSGGPAGEGNDGNQSSSSSGAAGASAVSGGGAGGAGGNSAANGTNGGAPGGAGGGAGSNTVTQSSKTYPAADPGGTYAYRGSDATDDPNALLNHDGPMFQGFPNASYGTQYSYFILPWAQIQSDLAGLNITSVSMKFKCLYSYYSSGVYAHVYYTSLDSFGNTGNRTSGSPTYVGNYLIKENATITQNLGLNGGIGAALQSGAAKSIQFSSIPLTPAGDYYGSFDSGANNGVIPNLIVYYNNGGGSTAGTGSDGQCILTFQAGAAPVYTLSVSATASADVFGNPYNPGFQGPLLTLTATTTPTSTAAATALAANTSATAVVTTNSPGFTGTMAANQSDIGRYTLTSTSLVPMSRAYIIPAGDAQVGTLYRLSVWGDATYGATAESLAWSLIGWGNTYATAAWGQAPTLTNTTYEWYVTMIAQILVTGSGSSGSVQTWLTGTYGIFNTNLGNAQYGGALTGAIGLPDAGINTTAAGTLELQMKFGGPATAHSYGSMLERLGP